MCIDMQPVSTIYVQYNLQFPFLNLSIPSLIFYMYHFLPLLPDLHYVDLIPGNLKDTPTHTPPTPPHQLENIQTGTVLPPVPTSLVEKIESGAIIKMADPNPTCLGLDDTACSKLRCTDTY